MTAIVLEGEFRIPASVVDLDSFRRWARSESFPKHGWYSYLRGELWVDLSMEQLFSHNQVKFAYTYGIAALLHQAPTGRFFMDRAFLTNSMAELSTEPDGMFVSWETFRNQLVRLVEGVKEGYVEIEGTPDMVLEVVSAGSVQKDTVELRELYWKAGIREYWLVDARGRQPRFEVLLHTPGGYVAAEPQDGWLASTVFGRSFQLTQQTDPLGHPQYSLLCR